MKKISLRGASWDSIFLTVGKLLTMAFSIISAKMMSAGLSLSEYGTYSQASLINSVGTSVILLGLGDALSYYFNGKQKEMDDQLRSRVVNTVFFLEIAAGLVLAAAVIFGQDLLINYFDNPAVRPLLPLAAFLPAFSNIIYFYHILYVGVGKAKLMSIYGVVLTIIRVVAVYFAVYILKNILLIYIVLLLLDLGQVLVYQISLAKRKVKINPFKISVRHIKPICAYGLPMGIYAITNAFSRELDKLVIGRLAGTEELAIYTNCSKLLPVDIFVTSFALVLIPYIIRYVTQKDYKQSIVLFSNYLKVGYYSVWILCAALLIAPSTMISFLYDDKYLSGTAIFVLYVFDSMLRFASMHQILVACNKTKLLMLYSIGSLMLNFVLNIALYHLFGLIGPAIATLISAIVYTWLILRKSQKLINAQWRDLFSVKEIAWLLLTIVGLWLICFMANKGLILLGVHKYISMILSMLIFGISALALHCKNIFATLKAINTFRI